MCNLRKILHIIVGGLFLLSSSIVTAITGPITYNIYPSIGLPDAGNRPTKHI